MKKSELINLKKLLQQELERRNNINALLKEKLIKKFILLNNLDINELQTNNKWLILEEILQNFKISESNGILVCTNNYLTACESCYQETNYYTSSVDFDNNYIEYQEFKDIETSETYRAYVDKFIIEYMGSDKAKTPSEFCHSRFFFPLVSELKEKHTILNPYNSIEDDNGYKEVQQDFFLTSIEKGQPKAKQLVLNKYPIMK